MCWRKSSFSSEEGDNCVELGAMSQAIAMRDSEDPDGPKILLTRDGFRVMLTQLKRH
ncbi:DUF397 domain-containing protein [Actinomadura fibrosa]|uniref:DUF397 domain-containing protein n=1 Tax=Actinomadura fibrosa TaxID=111802 RepID=A0ABW2XRX4_9ACTN|nr:DUF397 domain-containing protein [Actinomadura fibrosa]